MIWKFMVSLIALVLVTTGTGSTQWIEGRHKATTNPFDADYGKDYVYAQTFDKNGSRSYIMLYRYEKDSRTVYCDLILAFDICCGNNDGELNIFVQSAIDGDRKNGLPRVSYSRGITGHGVISDDLRKIEYGWWKKRRFWYDFLVENIRAKVQFSRYPQLKYFYEGNELWIRIVDKKSRKIRYLQFDISGKPDWSR